MTIDLSTDAVLFLESGGKNRLHSGVVADFLCPKDRQNRPLPGC
jgi:hypothetical protein